MLKENPIRRNALTLFKTVSWRIIAILINLIVSYTFTGKLIEASSISIFQMIASTAAFYMYEKIWLKISWEKGPNGFESRKRSLLKTLLWHCLATSITFGSVYLFLGELRLSLHITLIAASIGIPGYYLHERIWNYFSVRQM